MTEWRRNEGVFWRREKFEFSDACHSAIIWSFKHHSISIISLDYIGMSLNERKMRSEWFNLGLSPYRRQDWIKSFRPHLASFHTHFKDDIRMRNDPQMARMITGYMANWYRMTKWWWNDGNFRNRGFALEKNTPSFLLIPSFLHHSWLSEWSAND